MFRHCGGCGKRIFRWQKIERHDLTANPWRTKMYNVTFHVRCWENMSEEAK